MDHSKDVQGVDFSPDSTKLVSASQNGTATIWSVANGEKVQVLQHESHVDVIAARYSLDGDRIATATRGSSVQVWDSANGQLLVVIPVTVTPSFNNGLRWFNDHLLVVSDKRFKQLDASTGSIVSEWSVPGSDIFSCIALPTHGKFIAYSANRTVTLWDPLTHSQLGLIEHSEDVYSVALSSDDDLLAIGGKYGKIVIESLSRFTVRIIYRCLMAYLNSSESDSTHFSNRIRSHCLLYIPHLRNQTFRYPPLYRIQTSRYTPLYNNQTFKSTLPLSTHGKTISLKTQRRH